MVNLLNQYAAAFYGAATLVALGLAGLSGRPTTIKFALILLVDWVLYNLLVEFNGYQRSPLLIPAFNAVFGVWVASMAWANQSKIGGFVFALYAAVVAWWWFNIAEHTQDSYACYLGANLIFLLQVVAVGGSSAWSYVADRVYRRQLRFYHRAARG